MGLSGSVSGPEGLDEPPPVRLIMSLLSPNTNSIYHHKCIIISPVDLHSHVSEPNVFTTTLFYGLSVGLCPGLPTSPWCIFNMHDLPTDPQQAPSLRSERTPPAASPPAGLCRLSQTSRGQECAPLGQSTPPTTHMLSVGLTEDKRLL